MTIEETRALWERFKIADSAHDAEGTAAVYAEDGVLTGTPLRGRATLKKFDSDFWALTPLSGARQPAGKSGQERTE